MLKVKDIKLEIEGFSTVNYAFLTSLGEDCTPTERCAVILIYPKAIDSSPQDKDDVYHIASDAVNQLNEIAKKAPGYADPC